MKFRSILFLALQLPFCMNVDTQAMAQHPNRSGLRISIKRDYCFGSCPVYSAVISGDGTVTYLGKDFVKVKGKRRYRISNDKLKQLVDEFMRVNYLTLKDVYSEDEQGMSVTDLPSTTTSIRINGKYKQVYNYYGSPKVLNELENKIDELAGLSRLINKK